MLELQPVATSTATDRLLGDHCCSVLADAHRLPIGLCGDYFVCLFLWRYDGGGGEKL